MATRLVTDDAAFMRTVIKTALNGTGHTIIEASNGKEMLDRFKEYSPDVVTLDITMPEMDGLEALKELKKINPKAKVIMCSAMGQQARVVDAIQHGAIDFIVKPFANDRILDAISKAIKKEV